MTLVHRLLPGPKPHEALRAEFRWPVPEHYNIAVDVCDRWAAAEPDRVALIHKQQDGAVERLTYGDLAHSSNRLANALRVAGLGRGDRIGLLLPQCPETAITHLAVYKLGAIAVPLAALFGPDALEYRLTTSGAKGLVTDAQGREKVKPIRGRTASLEFMLSIDGD
ncbi:MAG: AMP-binding protein, partial [Methyloligellaceae bacterium]